MNPSDISIFLSAVPLNSMMLINALLTHVSDERWDEFIGELERLNVRKAVVVSL